MNRVFYEWPISYKKERELGMSEKNLDKAVLFKLSYGLFVLSTRDGKKDNGCIINTVTQISGKPETIMVAVNKDNYTHDLIMSSEIFNVSVLTEDTPFELFQHFGFQSGRTVDKFSKYEADCSRSGNGVLYLKKYTNAYMSAKVVKTMDCGTHTMFYAEVVEGAVLSEGNSVTYAYYFDNIKPKKTAEKKKGFVCEICGYVYEGEELPADFTCPWCKHGPEAFRPL